MKADAANDKAGGLAKSEAAAATRASGEQFGIAAEAYMANGNYPKAIELFQKGIAKGEMDASAIELLKLRLGVAQFKGGKKADAVKTWQAIKADNGAAWLAKSWMAIAKG
jgi:tetratricopeptide (TPR) repeat protein